MWCSMIALIISSAISVISNEKSSLSAKFDWVEQIWVFFWIFVGIVVWIFSSCFSSSSCGYRSSGCGCDWFSRRRFLHWFRGCWYNIWPDFLPAFKNTVVVWSLIFSQHSVDCSQQRVFLTPTNVLEIVQVKSPKEYIYV